MRNGLTAILFLLFLVNTRAQVNNTWEAYEVKSSAKDSFKLAQTRIDRSDGDDGFIKGMGAILFVRRMGEDDISDSIALEGFAMPCQCVFQNDTLSIVSALAWEGGFAYMASATKKSSSVNYWQFGEDRKWKLNGKEYRDEIHVPSTKNKLVISSPLPLKINKMLYGWFDVKTPEFIEISGDSEEKQQHILRIYFGCRVDPVSSF